MAIDIAQSDATIAASSPVLLSEAGSLRRLPLGPELERPQSFYDRFDDWAVFYDVFRDHRGKHVYLLGPMALNLKPYIDELVVEGVQSGIQVRPKVYHGVQAIILRAKLPEADTHLRLSIGDQQFELAIQPNQSQALAGDRAIFTINKDNDLQWIADWARFYVREHGATAVVVYDNGSTEYGLDDIRRTLSAVEGLKKFLVIPWPYRYGSMGDVYTKHKFGGHWPQFAQPTLFVQFFRKYAMQARSILNVDVDELVMSPFRKSVFKAVERSPFGLLRFNRVWVLNAREEDGPPRHRHFVIRKKGVAARDRGKKWALTPGRAFFASWRAQPWTHQVKGWLNLSGSSDRFYGYHFIGISHSWYWDRTEKIVFDPKLHVRDPLMIKTFADVFGPEPKQ
ncbi:glycosyltransferase family 92 protein [Devosia neptuniae]|uniref:Glycosyltransferase family 92 protein n=1 Tax=Devosia neptuniae TaxID=191302 RepID=A0ABY6CFX4_9HYPH|nr:glycosyltransferase family 92 protein [Devosia neptuniae]UXN71065.1 glycosyltransferase family 92 protein [Devosia neptuniae]